MRGFANIFQIFPLLTILIKEVFPKRDILLQSGILSTKWRFFKEEMRHFLFSVDIWLKVEKFCFYTSNYVVEKLLKRHNVKGLLCYLKEEGLINNLLLVWITAPDLHAITRERLMANVNKKETFKKMCRNSRTFP